MTSINIIYVDNGGGLSRDFCLLADALRSNGCDVAATPLTDRDERWRRKKRSRWLLHSRRWWHRLSWRRVPARFDVNIMLEHLWPQYLDQAGCNVAVPNPEWFDRHDMHFLPDIDRVWAKTRYGASIYRQLNCATHYVGFAGDDRFDPATSRQREFLHLAGASRTKGTRHTLEVWARHPEWPMLQVIQDPREAKPAPAVVNINHRIANLKYEELRHLQNSHAFHLCLSETEAWGHYLVEALSVGAITLTTDAPPMNELVAPDRGLLVPYSATGHMALATTYYFDEQAFVQSINHALSLSDAQMRSYHHQAREWFLENNRSFTSRIGAAIQATLA